MIIICTIGCWLPIAPGARATRWTARRPAEVRIWWRCIRRWRLREKRGRRGNRRFWTSMASKVRKHSWRNQVRFWPWRSQTPARIWRSQVHNLVSSFGHWKQEMNQIDPAEWFKDSRRVFHKRDWKEGAIAGHRIRAHHTVWKEAVVEQYRTTLHRVRRAWDGNQLRREDPVCCHLDLARDLPLLGRVPVNQEPIFRPLELWVMRGVRAVWAHVISI